MDDIKNLLNQKNELAQVWDYLGLDAEFPDKQVRLWLLDYAGELIESAFKVLAVKEDRVDEPVKFLAACLRNAKERNMTPEEREEQISAMRGMAARVKAHKQHLAKVKAEKDAFAKALQEDADVCTDLQTDAGGLQNCAEVSRDLMGEIEIGFEVESVIGSEIETAIVTEGKSKPKSKGVASLPAAIPDGRKEQTKPSNPGNTAGASGFSANKGKGKTPKTKIARNGKPYPPGFDQWTNVKRTEWLVCICDTHEDCWGWNAALQHRKDCPAKLKPEAAAATVGTLGNVAEL